MKKNKAASQPLLPYIVLGASLFIILLATTLTYRYSRQAETLQFEAAANEATDAIVKRFEVYIANLRAAAGFYYSSDILTGAEWKSFVQEIDPINDPGLQGIGYVRSFTAAEKPLIESRARAEGYPNFSIRPDTQRELYTAIIYLEPMDERNAAAIGFDMFTEETRRAAMERARDTGKVSISGKVTLVQEITEEVQPGFLIYYPIYRKGTRNFNEGSRRVNHVGYVYSPLRAHDFVNAAIQGENPSDDLRIRIYDGAGISKESLIYARGNENDLPSDFTSVRRVNVGGRTWVIEYSAPKGFSDSVGRRTVPYLFLGGLLLSFLFFALTRSQIINRNRAERAAVRLSFLSEASRLLSSSLDFEETLRNVAEVAVPNVADWCTVSVVDGHGKQISQVVAHKDPEKVKWANEIRDRAVSRPNENFGIAKVLRTGKTEYIPVVTEKMIAAAARDSDHLNLLKQLGLTSVIIAPLISAGRSIGAISFVAAESNSYFDSDDVSMAEEVASRAALAIENARLFAEVRKAVSVRDDFMATASHELKTPLTSQKLLIEYLKKMAHEDGNTKYISFLERLDSQATRLTKLIVDLIDVSKLEAGKMVFSKKDVDLGTVVRDAVDDAKLLSNKHTFLLEGCDSCVVRADKDRIQQVITNLLSNAVKYSPESEKIIIKLDKNDAEAVVEVKDFGIGIDKVHMDMIFDRFFRVSGPDERTYPGMGLGLHISAEIIKRHGGRIWAESEKGKGSTFCFSLPLAH